MVSFLRGGRIGGYLSREGATFWLSKRLHMVSRLDPKLGHAGRTESGLARRSKILERRLFLSAPEKYKTEQNAEKQIVSRSAIVSFSRARPDICESLVTLILSRQLAADWQHAGQTAIAGLPSRQPLTVFG
jgi:hypothetical protein